MNGIESIANIWRTRRHILRRVDCRLEKFRGVYCLQYHDVKIILDLRDNIKVCERILRRCLGVFKSMVFLSISTIGLLLSTWSVYITDFAEFLMEILPFLLYKRCHCIFHCVTNKMHRNFVFLPLTCLQIQVKQII